MKKMNMGFLWLLLGGFFLWNPVVGVKDVLPDVIGYFLLCMGVLRLTDLNDDLADAQKAFRSMLWVSGAQLAAWILVSGFLQKTEMDMNQYEEPVWVLVFAFVFLVLEWYIMLPAWKLFFKGLSDLARYHGGSAILTASKGNSLCERMIKRTRGFVIVKTLLTVLPEASVLTSFEAEIENSVFVFDWFPFLSAFRALAVLVGLVIGVIWLIGFCKLMLLAIGDKPWQECLCQRYRLEILPDVGLLLNRRVKDAFLLFKVGIVFCINLTVQYREILPDWISVILFLCGGLFLMGLLGEVKPCLWSGGALLAVGIARTCFNEAFLKDEWTPEAALAIPSVADQYLTVRILSWLEAAATFAFVLFVMRALLSMAKRHTSVDYGDDPALSERATARLHSVFRKKAIWVIVAFGASAIAKILEIELQPQQGFGWIWMVQVAVSAAAAVLFCSYLDSLAEAIASRYPARGRIN